MHTVSRSISALVGLRKGVGMWVFEYMVYSYTGNVVPWSEIHYVPHSQFVIEKRCTGSAGASDLESILCAGFSCIVWEKSGSSKVCGVAGGLIVPRMTTGCMDVPACYEALNMEYS